MRESIETAKRASRSAAQLVQRLLAFSRTQTLQPAQVDVNALITGMADMIARTLGETIEVRTALAPDVHATFADRNQLESALLNLVVNARDAMPDGGRLTIRTENVCNRDSGVDSTAGEYVAVSVQDTGCGIAAEMIDRVFEPFFTTKDTGKGSGLGLSMVYGFVKQSGGHVRIASEIGRGTTVRIVLPRASQTKSSASPSHVDATSHTEPSRARGGEAVLVVEDNDEVRRFAVSALQNLGYRTVQASDGPSALRILDELDPRIDLLFTDVVLPGGMSGSALARAVQRRHRNLPVLYTSGYTKHPTQPDALTDTHGPMLAKPYSIERLATAVRDAIDGTSPAKRDE
jgi:CheY-like chemotaxis protein